MRVQIKMKAQVHDKPSTVMATLSLNQTILTTSLHSASAGTVDACRGVLLKKIKCKECAMNNVTS